MSASYAPTDLEARIAELENRIQKQDEKIRLLASVTTLGFQALFVDPLQAFFESPEFWEIIYEDVGACFNRCAEQHRAALNASRGDKDAENKATLAAAGCGQGCDELLHNFDF